MSIISLSPNGIKASESYNDNNIDDTATELLGLREFVVESSLRVTFRRIKQ